MMKKKFSLSSTHLLIDSIDTVFRIKASTTELSTQRAYQTIFNRFIFWLDINEISEISVSEFTKEYAVMYMIYIQTESWANITKNKYLGRTKELFQKFLEMGYTQVNPFEGMKKLKVPKEVPSAWDEQTKNIVFSYLKKNDIMFYYFSCFIYYCFIRPSELISLKVSDFRLKEEMIILRKEYTKTKKNRLIRISRPLGQILIKMGFDKLNQNDYLFGRLLESGKKPMPSSDYTGRRFKRLREKLEIPDHIKLYSLKHTGIQDHLNNGVPINQIALQSGLTLEILQVYAETSDFLASNSLSENAPYLPTEKKIYSRTNTLQLIKKIKELPKSELKIVLKELDNIAI